MLFIMQTACSAVQPGIQGETVSINRHTSGQHWAAAESGSMLMSVVFMGRSLLIC